MNPLHVALVAIVLFLALRLTAGYVDLRRRVRALERTAADLRCLAAYQARDLRLAEEGLAESAPDRQRIAAAIWQIKEQLADEVVIGKWGTSWKGGRAS